MGADENGEEEEGSDLCFLISSKKIVSELGTRGLLLDFQASERGLIAVKILLGFSELGLVTLFGQVLPKMGLGPETVQIEIWDVGNSKGKKRKKKKERDLKMERTGCCFSFKLMGVGCFSSRSKVNSSISGASTHCGNLLFQAQKCPPDLFNLEFCLFGVVCVFSFTVEHVTVFPFIVGLAEIKSPNAATNLDQPVVLVVSSATTSAGESSASTPKVVEELKVSSQLRKFSFNELKSATRNFRPESLLGEGGFGCVFKGWVEENGTGPVKPGTGLTVAVKTLNHDGLQGHKEWLVWSLPLPWSIRLKIALGAAKGLAFLHEEAERPVIYRDFKTSNILLDAEYNAKLSDFGLAKDGPEGDKTHVSTRVMGTYGYAAPEYVMTGHLTSRSDVYSFGVVLLEMLTGRRSMDKNRPNGEHNLVEWARPYLGEKRRFYRLIDPRLEGNFSIKGAQKAALLAQHCLSRDPKARPLMSEVVEALKPLLNLKDMASSSHHFQAVLAERTGSNSFNARAGIRGQPLTLSRNGQVMRSPSMPTGSHASPYHRQHLMSPKPNGKKKA
ncbi:hypothetical protein Sjap_023808 [Stephania japonica]|uniref:Protein kinase domain-containing protein n=1 Tax=Stephania japonica TaxID=461633 RepID=A0AAP0HNB8_9MAGN